MDRNTTKICTYLRDAFVKYCHTSNRSTKKLEVIHGGIAHDINEILQTLPNYEDYEVVSKGFGNNKEESVIGSETEKDCDITIMNKRTNKAVIVIMVKMILGNYKQNSINYFENMKGETDNLQATGIPVFELIFIKDKTPYFSEGKEFQKWEHLTEHDMEKYSKLGNRVWGGSGQPYLNSCIPYYTLLVPYHLNDMPKNPKNMGEYMEYYKNNEAKVTLSYEFKDLEWGNISYNDYDSFLDKARDYLTNGFTNHV
jgi:hypothetical protein